MGCSCGRVCAVLEHSLSLSPSLYLSLPPPSLFSLSASFLSPPSSPPHVYLSLTPTVFLPPSLSFTLSIYLSIGICQFLSNTCTYIPIFYEHRCASSFYLPVRVFIQFSVILFLFTTIFVAAVSSVSARDCHKDNFLNV